MRYVPESWPIGCIQEKKHTTSEKEPVKSSANGSVASSSARVSESQCGSLLHQELQHQTLTMKVSILGFSAEDEVFNLAATVLP